MRTWKIEWLTLFEEGIYKVTEEKNSEIKKLNILYTRLLKHVLKTEWLFAITRPTYFREVITKAVNCKYWSYLPYGQNLAYTDLQIS